MKKTMSFLIVVFSLFGFQLAQASDSCEAPELKFKLSDLKFFNEPYTDVLKQMNKRTECVVVKSGNSGQKALAACSKKGKYFVVNPGNPQYVGEGHGDLLDNKLGYFFCMPGADKKQLCTYMEKKNSGMDVDWSKRTTSDGDCECKRKGTPETAYRSCPVDTTPLQAGQSTGCNVANANNKNDSGKCLCIYDQSIEATQGKVCPTEPQKEVTATVDDNDFEECFSEIKTAQENCSKKGQDAINNCSKEAPKVNKNIAEAQRVLSIGLDALVAGNAGKGALESCQIMSAGGTTALEALKLMQKNCKDELANCKKGCEDMKAYTEKKPEEFVAECKAKFEEKNKETGKTWSPQHDARVAELAKTYQGGADNAEKFCKGDAKVADGEIQNFLDRLALSVQKADVCRCQLTSANVNPETCENILTPLSCIQNVNQPGCSFSSVGCSPGSTIAGCRNPIGMTNPNGSGVAMPASGFAGPGFGSGGGGSANSGKVGVGGDDFDFSDDTRPAGSGTATADAGSPFGVAAGGGGGGGGGGGAGGGGGGTGDGADGEEKDKGGGLSGFFQSAKGGIASLFGAGADNKNAAAKKPDNKAYKNDVNGFRPKAGVRGMAGGSNEFGGKNRDIWKTMNERYNDQYHTFITVENPQK